MPYKCLTYVMVGEERKNPGQSVTKAEFMSAGQTDANIAQLLEGGAISEDMDAPIHSDHASDPFFNDIESDAGVITSNDVGGGVDSAK